MTINDNDYYFWTSSNGEIEFEIKGEYVNLVPRVGVADYAIEYMKDIPEVRVILDAIQPEVLRSILSDYGAWDDKELQDHESNLERMLWIACGDIQDYDEEQLANIQDIS